MTDADKRAVCIGEAIVELARGADGRFALASSGDTFNTAIYLARAGLPVAFASALGDDPFSDAIVSLAQAEGIGTDLILRAGGRLPGLAWSMPTARANGAFIIGARRRRRANCLSCRNGAAWRKAWLMRG